MKKNILKRIYSNICAMLVLGIVLLGLTACSSWEKYYEVTITLAESNNVSQQELEATVSVLKNRFDDMKITKKDISIDSDIYAITVRFATPYEISKATAIVAKLCTMSKLSFKDENGKVVLDGKDVKEAKSLKKENNYTVDLKLTAEGSIKFNKATENNIGKTITISIDDVILMSPKIEGAITGDSISINLRPDSTADYAKSLAEQIDAGALPYALKAGIIKQVDGIDGSVKVTSTAKLDIVGMWRDVDGTIRIFSENGTCKNVAGIDIGGSAPTYTLSEKKDSNGYYLLNVEQGGYNQTTFYVKADSNDSIKIYESSSATKPLYSLKRQ